MPLDIKTVRGILDDAVAQGVGITEDSDVLFAVGEPSKGGEIYLVVDTCTASCNVEGEEQTAFFFNLETVQNVIDQQIDMINPNHKEAMKEEV